MSLIDSNPSAQSTKPDSTVSGSDASNLFNLRSTVSTGHQSDYNSACKSRNKPRLFRQSNAELDLSPNKSLSVSSSELETSREDSQASFRTKTAAPVPQVSVTASSPEQPELEKPWDLLSVHNNIEYIDTGDSSEVNELFSNNCDSISSEDNPVPSKSCFSASASLVKGSSDEDPAIGERVGEKAEGKKRARYLTRTLALLRLQSRFRKSRSEDAGDKSRRLMHANEETSGQPNKSCSSVSLYRGVTSRPAMEETQEPYILGIHIHSTDRKLRSSTKNKSVVHPLVKVHIVDITSECYLTKKHADRDVTFFYENSYSNKINYILPVMTQKCDLISRIRYPRYPIWEELLLYNEDYSYFISDNVIILFEILDFVTFTNPNEYRYSAIKSSEWWYRIAWAFLTIRSSDGSFNTEKKLRLQLYKPLSEKINCIPGNTNSTEIFQWWKDNKRIPLPGSLYVTISKIPLILTKETFSPTLRSFGPLHPEKTSLSILNDKEPSIKPMSKSLDQGTLGSDAIWSRIEGQPCKIPKQIWHQFSAGNNKCSYSVRFSRDGKKIACGASVFTAYRSNEKRSSIFIYEIPSGKFLKRVNGFHSGAIYDIDWSNDDAYLISASSDCTAHVWNNLKDYQTSIMLPHPCFVYSARFHPQHSGTVFTGAYDGLIRIWCIRLSLESTAVEPQLVQEIDCFYGQVLSLAWKQEKMGQTKLPILFASSSKGEIVVIRQRDVSSDFTWYLSSTIRMKEIIDVPINNIVIHPFASKILIVCRDGVQRMLDYQLEIVVQRFTGALNFHHLIRGCITVCGRYVFAGSEDGQVHVWSADTGEKLHTYSDLPFKGPISCVEYHPHDHIVAICGLNARTISVCLYRHQLPKKSEDDQPIRNNQRPEFLRSKTVDQSNENSFGRRGNLKVQRAVRKLEFVLRNKSAEKKVQP